MRVACVRVALTDCFALQSANAMLSIRCTTQCIRPTAARFAASRLFSPSRRHSGHVKIIDFGLAADMSRGAQLGALGTSYWMAPEMIKRKPHTIAADVWSFGIVVRVAQCGAVLRAAPQLTLPDAQCCRC